MMPTDNNNTTSRSTQQDPERRRRTDGPQRSRRAYILARLSFISLLILLVAGAIIFMAVNTTIIRASAWNEKGQRHLDDTVSIKPLRGDILAGDGSILATNLNYFNLRIDFKAKRFMIREYVASLDSLCDSLAYHFPRRTRDEWKEYLSAPLKKERSKRSSSFLLLKEVPDDAVRLVKQFPYFRRSSNANRTGLVRERVLKRKYPYGDMAALSIGRVGEVALRDVRGASGLERALDSLLYGQPGIAKRVLMTDRIANWTVRKPRNGYTVTTTIDITMQDILEHELGEMLLTTEAEWGTAIIMDVETGDIKAISNLERDTVPGSHRYIEGMNRAVLAYEPGSVVKTISMIVAMRKGLVTPGKTFHIEPKGVGYRYCGGRPINDTHSPSTLEVDRFLEYSSNIGMTKLLTGYFESEPDSFRRALSEIGFFDRFHTGMERERTPYFPRVPANKGGRIALSRMVFGYSTMIPPLYTCAMYNAVANGGRFVRPRLVKGLRHPDGRDSVIPVSYVRDSILTSAQAAELRHMLHEVVWGQGGTAKALKNELVTIAGKTGTCRIAVEAPPAPKKTGADSAKTKGREQAPARKPGGYLEGRYRLAFCGFFPYEKPKYTCMVLINDPSPAYRGAATTSGMVLKNVALKLYSRGMLGNTPDYHDGDAPADGPTLYASYDTERYRRLADGIKMPHGTVIQTHAEPKAGHIPDVRGLGIREAVVKLEKSGYNVSFSGTGYVATQSPAGGTPAPKGSRVNITLQQN